MKYDVKKTFEDNALAIGVTIKQSNGTWLVSAGNGSKLFTDKDEMVCTVMGFFDA